MLRHNRVRCDVCEGTGRTSPDSINDPSGRTWRCHYGCDDGFFDAVATDLDGKRARHGFVVGALFVWKGALCLQSEDCDDLVVLNLDPLTVEILNG